MKILVITGDPSFKPGNERFDIQASVVECLVSLYWGHDAAFPRVPNGSYDVVTVQDPFLRGFVAWCIARVLGARFNVQLHADFTAQHLMKRLIGKFVLHRADSIRVVSEKLVQQIQSLGAHAPITVLPIFVPPEQFKSVVRTPSAEPSVLWVGRFENEKDPLNAIQVFSEVLQRVPDARLVMLGTGSLENAVRKAARDLPVAFPGFQDVRPYLAHAHVMLSTSRAESWGASIVEALAAGVPVVAPDVGVASEAGAIVVPREQLAKTIIATLAEKPPAQLHITLHTQAEWLDAWKASLT